MQTNPKKGVSIVMKKYRHSKTSLFLLEIMINILFFAVLVTICLQLFFKAHNLSSDTTVLHRAVTACTSIAEVYQSTPNGEEMILNLYPEAVILNDTILIYFNYGFAPCSKFESTYRAILSNNEDSQTMQIRFLQKDETDAIYELTVSSYSPKTLDELIGGELP